jgi:hypothetical protein
MKLNLLLAILLSQTLSLIAQTTEPKIDNTTDPLDVSMQKEQIEKYGIVTMGSVSEMKTKADALYDSESWEQAAAAYEIYARNVNWLANLLAQCVEPYYSASYDKRKATPISAIRPYIPFENKANECKENRNRAFVKMGLCYKNIGDLKNSVAYLHQGLELLDVEDKTYWKMAADALAEILGFVPEK